MKLASQLAFPNMHKSVQREALEGPGNPTEDTDLDAMDTSIASADQYETYEEDEDQLYMQQAPNDTLIALQLLRSQFPAKARVGTFSYLLVHALSSAYLHIQVLSYSSAPGK